jgi:hypothetical protein
LVPAYLKTLNEEDVMRGRLVTELKLAAKEMAGVPAAGARASARPVHFVEFNLSAPLRLDESLKPVAKGTRP